MKFSDLWINTDIPFGSNGNVAKAGTPMHKAMVKAMEEEQKQDLEAKHNNYVAQLTEYVKNLDGLAEDDYTEAFIIRKNLDEITVEVILDSSLIDVAKYRRNKNKGEKSPAS